MRILGLLALAISVPACFQMEAQKKAPQVSLENDLELIALIADPSGTWQILANGVSSTINISKRTFSVSGEIFFAAGAGTDILGEGYVLRGIRFSEEAGRPQIRWVFDGRHGFGLTREASNIVRTTGKTLGLGGDSPTELTEQATMTWQRHFIETTLSLDALKLDGSGTWRIVSGDIDVTFTITQETLVVDGKTFFAKGVDIGSPDPEADEVVGIRFTDEAGRPQVQFAYRKDPASSIRIDASNILRLDGTTLGLGGDSPTELTEIATMSLQ